MRNQTSKLKVSVAGQTIPNQMKFHDISSSTSLRTLLLTCAALGPPFSKSRLLVLPPLTRTLLHRCLVISWLRSFLSSLSDPPLTLIAPNTVGVSNCPRRCSDIALGDLMHVIVVGASVLAEDTDLTSKSLLSLPQPEMRLPRERLVGVCDVLFLTSEHEFFVFFDLLSLSKEVEDEEDPDAVSLGNLFLRTLEVDLSIRVSLSSLETSSLSSGNSEDKLPLTRWWGSCFQDQSSLSYEKLEDVVSWSCCAGAFPFDEIDLTRRWTGSPFFDSWVSLLNEDSGSSVSNRSRRSDLPAGTSELGLFTVLGTICFLRMTTGGGNRPSGPESRAARAISSLDRASGCVLDRSAIPSSWILARHVRYTATTCYRQTLTPTSLLRIRDVLMKGR